MLDKIEEKYNEICINHRQKPDVIIMTVEDWLLLKRKTYESNICYPSDKITIMGLPVIIDRAIMQTKVLRYNRW